jgi:hypothetical protein
MVILFQTKPIDSMIFLFQPNHIFISRKSLLIQLHFFFKVKPIEQLIISFQVSIQLDLC